MPHILQRMLTSEHLADTIDNIAKAIVNIMEPGPTRMEINNEISSMIIKKDTANEILRKISSLPSTLDNDEVKIDVRLIPTTTVNMTARKNYSVQVSEEYTR